MEELDKKIIELNNKINALDARISFLEIVNKHNKNKKIFYYCFLGLNCIVIPIISYFILKKTYGEIISYLT